MLRTLLLVAYRLALAISGLSLLYLLFIFGHTETTPLKRVLATAALAGISALVAGLLHWVGLPSGPKEDVGKKRTKGRSAGRSG